jgi:hypothetical protein
MKPPDDKKKAPAEVHYTLGGSDVEDSDPPDSKRSVRRQYLSKRLHAAGPRPVLEALLAVDGGQPLDDVLEGFARVPSSFYSILRRQLLCPDTRRHYEV